MGIDQQEEELIALESLYDSDFIKHLESHRFDYEIIIRIDSEGILPPSGTLSLSPLRLYWIYTKDYPSVLPNFELICEEKDGDCNGMKEKGGWFPSDLIKGFYREMIDANPPDGEQVLIFGWVEWIKSNVFDYLERVGFLPTLKEKIRGWNEEKEASQNSEINLNETEEEEETDYGARIMVGVPFVDRKSKFQGFLSVVHSKDEVDEVLWTLKQNKRIREATHNIVAYRIEKTLSDGRIIMNEDRDDDGETGAGDKLLFMLQKTEAKNVVVIVTRWFGGIMLGTDRFKDITNVGKGLVLQHLESNPTPPKSSNVNNRSGFGKKT